jgi:hypothetical protein
MILLERTAGFEQRHRVTGNFHTKDVSPCQVELVEETEAEEGGRNQLMLGPLHIPTYRQAPHSKVLQIFGYCC